MARFSNQFLQHLNVLFDSDASTLSHFASKYKGTFSINYRKQGSQEQGVFPTQYTSRIGTARVK